jgi:solute carrier family 25 (mitochondrial 2-oxodicarboxylate transporter), member 21
MEVLKSVFGAGTAAIITVSFIHPIDVVKTRLQISSGKGGEGTRNYKALRVSGTVKVILKEEGIKSFWKGIGPAWLREAS